MGITVKQSFDLFKPEKEENILFLLKHITESGYRIHSNHEGKHPQTAVVLIHLSALCLQLLLATLQCDRSNTHLLLLME